MRSLHEPVLVAALLLSGCAGKDGGDSADTGVVDETDPCQTLTWQTFGEGYMRSWCTGCHSSSLEGDEREGAPAGVDLDTLAGVRSLAPRIEARVLDGEPTMPPIGGSSEEERERLRTWLECGMPE